MLDDSNYTAHVFAGLAASELANQQEAREHYKTAIALQPEEQLAWKVCNNSFLQQLEIEFFQWYEATSLAWPHLERGVARETTRQHAEWLMLRVRLSHLASSVQCRL